MSVQCAGTCQQEAGLNPYMVARTLDLMVTGWRFLAVSGGIFLAVVGIVQAVAMFVDRYTKRIDPLTEHGGRAEHRVEPPP